MNINIEIYNVQGHLVKNIIFYNKNPGEHILSWDVRNNYGARLPTGLYLARLISGKSSLTKKLILK